MIDERTMELLNGEVDGENSPEGSREARRLIDTSEDARRYYEDLLGLRRRFEREPELPPPPGLRSSILARTTRSGARASRRRRLVPEGFLDAFSPRVALAFAAGVAAGLTIFALVTGPDRGTPGPEAMRGSLLSWELPSGGDAAPGLELTFPDGLGECRVDYLGSLARVHVSLVTEGEAELVLRYGPSIRFSGLVAADESDHDIVIGERKTSLVHSGSGEYVLYLSNPGGTPFPIDVSVCEDGSVCFARSLDPLSP